MNRYVLDTSVAVAWYLPESFSQRARIWQQALLEDAIACHVPELHYWEFANVLRTYVTRKELTRELAEEIYLLHLDAPLLVLEPRRAAVLAVALDFRATAYDSVYISLALDNDMTLLTAEKSTTPWVTRLAEKAELVR